MSLAFIYDYRILNYNYQEILKEFLNKYQKSDQGFTGALLNSKYLSDFDENANPKTDKNWTRINNQGDGSCFYHTIWRFIIMSNHMIMHQIIKMTKEEHPSNPKESVIKLFEKPGWNPLATGILRQIIYNNYSAHLKEPQFLDSIKYDKEGWFKNITKNSESNLNLFGGDGVKGPDVDEIQLMADLLKINIMILTNISNTLQWHCYCPREPDQDQDQYYYSGSFFSGTCTKKKFTDPSKICFMVNGTKGQHFETLLPLSQQKLISYLKINYQQNHLNISSCHNVGISHNCDCFWDFKNEFNQEISGTDNILNAGQKKKKSKRKIKDRKVTIKNKKKRTLKKKISASH
jgi:hypothetical protein